MSINKTCYAVNFAEVLAMNIPEISSILEMFKDSELQRFLSCASTFNNSTVKQFFASARLEHGSIICTIGPNNYIISQPLFGITLELPNFGLGKVSKLPEGNADIWKASFSTSETLISLPTEKNDLKPEYILLANFVAMALLARAEAYDKITQEKFLYMALITSKIGVN